jgi:hypothetical protein
MFMKTRIKQTSENVIIKKGRLSMKKVLVFGFMFLFLFTGLAAQAQVPPGTFAPFVEGPAIVAGDPEAAIMPASVGFPRWLRDSRGIQLGLCLEQVAPLLEAPPCPGLETDPVTGEVIAASYYLASVVMCDDPLECDQSPGAVPPNGEIYIIEFAAGVEAPDPAAPEAPEGPGLIVRLRPGNVPLTTPFNVQTPFGNFPGLDLAPGRDEVRSFPAVPPALMKFRGNGTAGLIDVFAPEPVPGQPPIPPIQAGPFPGFIGNGLTAAPFRGPGGITFRVDGPRGSGITAQTNNVAVEGKVFTTPTAQAGGFLVERGTMAARGRNNGVLFASTNVAGATIQITSIAGQAANTTMITDPANPTRHFAVFPMGNLGGETEVGVSATVRDAAGTPVAQLEDIAHVMQDTITAAPATFRNGRLTVSARSSIPGSARAPGATFTFESVTSMNPADVGFVATPLQGTIRGGRFTATNAAQPPFVRINSSLGGSMIVPVKTTPQTGEIITIRRAIFNVARGTLSINASSSVRGTALTVEGVDSLGNVLAGPSGNLGTITRGSLNVPGLVVPPPFVKVSSPGGAATMTVPITFQ